MSRRESPRRTVRVGVGVVIALVVGSMTAPSAWAAPVTVSTVTTSGAPNVYLATASQPAGDIVVNSTTAVSVGDTITLRIDDSDIPLNCLTNGDTIGFSNTPTVAPTGTASAFLAVPSASSAACTTAGVNDVVTLTAQTSDPSVAWSVKLTNVRYTVGGAAPAVGLGPVSLTVNGAAQPANATIVNVRATANNPVVLVPSSTASTAISNIVLTELSAGAIPTGATCIKLSTPPFIATFDTTATPTVATTGGAAATPAAPTASQETITVGTASTTAGTYTISGLKLTSGAGLGFVRVSIGRNGACTDIATNLTIGLVGDTTRLAGANRYATAQKIADQYGCLTTVNVVVARGDNFPDALAASYLAGLRNSPIVLVDPNSIPAETANVLRQHGVEMVTLLGGTSAISTAVANALAATPVYTCAVGNPVKSPAQTLTVTRISGADRYDTAKAVAEFSGLNAGGSAEPGLDAASLGTCGSNVRTAIVASGANFPDALAAGPLAASGAHGTCPGPTGPLPLLLTEAAALSTPAQDALINMGIKQVVLMGGTAAVSAATQATIAALNGGIQVVRIQGTTRQATAAALASTVLANPLVGGFGTSFLIPATVFVARPDSAPDSLAAGPYAGSQWAPLLLTASTTSLGSIAGTVISSWPVPGLPIVKGFVAGGTSALSAGVLAELAVAMASQT